MEEWKEILLWLNECAGLFALFALVAAIIVPILIYKKQRENERQKAQEELDAIKENEIFPMSIEDRNYFVKKRMLEKTAKK